MHVHPLTDSHDESPERKHLRETPAARTALTWSALTRMPNKARLYQHDTLFREGVADALDVIGDRLGAILHRSALVMIKPEGLAGGKARTIVDFLQAHGFAIAAATLPFLTRLQWRELWRYQLAAATLDRLAVNDLILCDQALVLLLRHDGTLETPATVHLGVLKGPADIARQSPSCLRRLLAQPNRLFSYCHVADEPADILRELAVLFDGPLRRQLLANMVSGQLSAIDTRVLERTLVASTQHARPFESEGAIARMADAVRGICGVAAEQIRADIATMRRGEPIRWQPFVRAVAAAGIDIERWDLALLGAAFTVHDEPGVAKTIASVDAAAWRLEVAERSPLDG
ncbi:nucleoside-diphosphate kinase [Bradyrhizobium sp. 2TAF24]|uniref:nucleoside-diphosphate kinase n=1 Tax=Bradyrhizobium sp. 2TAF24 TaxID=3233011 RepID=UPI003F923AC5